MDRVEPNGLNWTEVDRIYQCGPNGPKWTKNTEWTKLYLRDGSGVMDQNGPEKERLTKVD